MTRRRLLVVGGAVVVAVTGLAVQVSLDHPVERVPTAARARDGLGPAPDGVVEDLRDPQSSFALREFRGKSLVVNFWAAWCAPCRREMPAFQSVYDDVKDDVAFLGIDNQDIRGDGLALVRETGVRYRLGFDPEGELARAFGVLGMPTTVFVSADGEMLERVTGEMSKEDLRATIRRLFGV